MQRNVLYFLKKARGKLYTTREIAEKLLGELDYQRNVAEYSNNMGKIRKALLGLCTKGLIEKHLGFIKVQRVLNGVEGEQWVKTHIWRAPRS